MRPPRPYAPRAKLLIVASEAAARRRAEAVAAALDLDITAAIAPDAATDMLSDRADAALIMLGERDTAALGSLTRPLTHAMEERDIGCVISMPIALVDTVHAAFGESTAELLCDPSDFELAGALGIVVSERTLRLHEPREERRDELAALRDEVGRIARALAALANRDDDNNGGGRFGEAPFAFRPAPAATPLLDTATVRAMIRTRRLREKFFAAELFADPAWDMLLDLMAARLEGRQIAVSSLCIAAAVPPTTALRWIRLMTNRGVFERRADPDDGRRVFIELADEAAAALARWFTAAAQLRVPVVA